MTTYLWIKVLHATAAIVFFSGVVAISLFLSVAGASTPPPQIIHRVRRWDRRIVQPAMVATWGLGLFIASLGHWLAQGWWLIVKVILVVLLTAIHGMQAIRLRRLGEGIAQQRIAWISPTLLALVAAIVSLVIGKPF